MEIRKLQATADINILVSLALSTGAPDTGATVTVKALKPDGTEHTTFTAPTITETVTGSGTFVLTFAAGATNKLFTLEDQHNPYYLVVSSSTAGSTWRRIIPVWISSVLPGEVATAAVLVTVDTVVDSILAGMATATALATVDGLVDSLTTNLATVDTVVDGIATAVADLPTLAEIEASTTLAKEAGLTFLQKVIKNKKQIVLDTGVYYLIVYDDNSTTPIMRKALKDIAAADIAAPASGVIASETKTTV
jgi:prefoldin subunit 5